MFDYAFEFFENSNSIKTSNDVNNLLKKFFSKNNYLLESNLIKIQECNWEKLLKNEWILIETGLVILIANVIKNAFQALNKQKSSDTYRVGILNEQVWIEYVLIANNIFKDCQKNLNAFLEYIEKKYNLDNPDHPFYLHYLYFKNNWWKDTWKNGIPFKNDTSYLIDNTLIPEHSSEEINRENNHQENFSHSNNAVLQMKANLEQTIMKAKMLLQNLKDKHAKQLASKTDAKQKAFNEFLKQKQNSQENNDKEKFNSNVLWEKQKIIDKEWERINSANYQNLNHLEQQNSDLFSHSNINRENINIEEINQNFIDIFENIQL